MGTSPFKSGQEESSVTPPGRTPAGATRSPSWGRQQHAARSKILLNNAVIPGTQTQLCLKLVCVIFLKL